MKQLNRMTHLHRKKHLQLKKHLQRMKHLQRKKKMQRMKHQKMKKHQKIKKNHKVEIIGQPWQPLSGNILAPFEGKTQARLCPKMLSSLGLTTFGLHPKSAA